MNNPLLNWIDMLWDLEAHHFGHWIAFLWIVLQIGIVFGQGFALFNSCQRQVYKIRQFLEGTLKPQ